MEGLAREVVSRVQRMRKEAGFAVSDRVVLAVDGSEEVLAAVRAHHAWIAEEVLARDITTGDGARKLQAEQLADIDGQPTRIAIERVV